MTSQKVYKGLPSMTTAARKEFEEHLLKMGKKTKVSYIEALHKELGGSDVRLLNLGDINRVVKPYLL